MWQSAGAAFCVSWKMLRETVADLRYRLRQLRKSPAFTAAAVVMLALGIGANAAIHSVIDAVLFRSLRYRDSDRLVMAVGG